MSVKFQPKNDKVLVRREAQITRTAGGLLVPDVAKDKALRGTALAVGPGQVNINGIFVPTTTKVGSTVTFGRYSGIEMAPLGPEFADCLLLSELEVYGELNGDEGVELEVLPQAEED